jgi:hypothetical protein
MYQLDMGTDLDKWCQLDNNILEDKKVLMLQYVVLGKDTAFLLDKLYNQ